MRGLGVPALIAAEEFLGGGSRRGHCCSALQTPFCSEQPPALAADISLTWACSVPVAISSRQVYVLKVHLGQAELLDCESRINPQADGGRWAAWHHPCWDL